MASSFIKSFLEFCQNVIRLIQILQLFLQLSGVMDKEQSAPETYCSNCQKMILTPNFEIHEARCYLKSSRVSQKNQQKKYKKQNNAYHQFQEENQQNGPIFSKPRRQSQPERKKIFPAEKSNQQKIPCSFCGYMQTLAQLDSHPNQCISMQKKCEYCDQFFPASIMNQHHLVCDKKMSIPNGHIHYQNNHLHPNFEDYQYSDEEEDQELNHFGNFRHFYSSPSANRRPQRGGTHTIRIINGRTIIEQDDGQRGYSRRQISNSNYPFMQSILQPDRPIQRRGNGFQAFFRLLQMMALNGREAEEGLTKEQLKKIKKIRYKAKPNNSTQKDLCTICYCEFENNESILELKCKHIYHEECIVKWLQKNIKCPVCKAPQTDREVHLEE